MATLLVEPPTEWLKLRRRTVILFTIETVLVGMDFSLTFLTLWLYINTLIKPEKPTVCYSVVSAAFLAASLTLSGLVGRIVDKTRKVRNMFFAMNSVVIVGNLLYAVPISPWTLGIGRLLSGFGGPLRSVIAGELARCYHPDALSKVLSIMGIAYSFGFIAGPVLNASFKDIVFYIGEWPVTFANFPGIYMAGMFLVVQLLATFLLSDISKIYDLKAEMTKTQSTGGLSASVNVESSADVSVTGFEMENTSPGVGYDHVDADVSSSTTSGTNNPIYNSAKLSSNNVTYGTFRRESKEHDAADVAPKNENESVDVEEKSPLVNSSETTPSVSTILRKMISTFDTSLLLSLAFFESYFAVTFDMWVPMLVIDTLGWSVSSLSWILLWMGIACVIPCIVLTCVTISDRVMYFIALGSVISFCVMESVFLVLTKHNHNRTLAVFSWILFGLLYTFLIVMEEVFLVGCLAKMVSSTIQTFADSIRLTMYRLGALIAFLTSALIYQWIEIVGWVHISAILVGFILMVIRRKSLMNPTIVI